MTKAEYKRQWYLSNKDRCKESVKLRREADPAKFYKSVKDWVINNRERSNAIKRAWVERNKDKNRELKRAYEKAHPERKKGNSAQRRARRIQATPKWLSLEYKKEIRRIYRECPVGYEVDHIVPLQGINVRGLHVPWNLQYLTSLENKRKRNKVAA